MTELNYIHKTRVMGRISARAAAPTGDKFQQPTHSLPRKMRQFLCISFFVVARFLLLSRSPRSVGVTLFSLHTEWIHCLTNK